LEKLVVLRCLTVEIVGVRAAGIQEAQVGFKFAEADRHVRGVPGTQIF
jgi:hypothetical protein